MPPLETTQPETGDRAPEWPVPILQTYNSLALVRVREALDMNLSAQSQAEHKR